MITRLILSLKKAASRENGWSFAEMTTMRRMDETIPMHANRKRPIHNVDRAGKGFRMLGGTEVSADTSEIAIADTESPEERR